MLQHNNIDRQDSVDISPAPFTYTSTLNMAGMQIPAGSFLSFKVYVPGDMLMPYRFHSVRPDGKVMICDSRGTLAGYWQTYSDTEPDVEYISSVLVNMQGVLMGHVVCTMQALDLVRRVVVSSLDTVFLPTDAFVFLPQCHIAMLSGYCRSFGVQTQDGNMEYHTGDLTVASKSDLIRQSLSDGTLTVSITNSKDRLEARADHNGIRYITIDGSTNAVSCVGKSIILKAVVESNLRVVMENNQIVLRGVLNA